MTDLWKVTSLGQIEEKETLQLGLKISLIISEEKIVYTHLVSITAMSGMTCDAAIAISTLVRKVRCLSVFLESLSKL